MEVEAKFIVDNPAILDELAGLSEIRGYELRFRKAKKQVDIYYDTARHQLLQAGACLRMRDDKDEFRVTFKRGDAGEDGVFSRDELEEVLPYQIDNINGLGSEPVRAAKRLLRRVRPAGTGAEWWKGYFPGSQRRRSRTLEPVLEPVLRVTNNRRVYDLVKDDEVRFELALDVGTFEQLDREDEIPFAELEVEIVSAEDWELRELAEHIAERFGLQPQEYSKYQRGMGRE